MEVEDEKPKNVEYIKKQLLQYKWRIVELLLISIVVCVLSMIVPMFMRYFTDEIIVGQKWELLTRTIMLFLAFSVIRFIADMVYEMELSKIVYGKMLRKQRHLLAFKMVRLNTKYLFKEKEKLAEKDLESVIVGDTDAFRGILSQTIKFMTEALKLLVLLAVIFYYSVPVGILSCIRIPLFFVVIKIFGKPLDNLNESVRTSKSELIQLIKKAFMSVIPIKSRGIEDKVVSELDSSIDLYTNKEK